MKSPLMLYLKPHHSHYAMGKAVNAEFVELNRGTPIERIQAARTLDIGNRPLITEGGKPLFQAVWMKIFDNCGPIIHLAADETIPNIFNKYPHYKHYERVVHYIEHRYVDGIIGISNLICESAKRLDISNIEKTYPFTEGWKYKRLSDITPSLSSNKVLVVGHNSNKNNFSSLGRVADLCSTNIEINVIGGGTENISGEHVTGHGFIEDEDRFIDLFEQASCFLFPAVSQMFAVVVLEAMHAGLPPVITRDVGAKELVSKVDKRLIAETTPHDIAHHLDWYLNLPKSKKKKISKSIQCLSEGHSPEKGVEKFKHSYMKVINGI